ncbi:MAG: hypothetical protein R3A46_06930 [Thermomicrobiales bacterium]
MKVTIIPQYRLKPGGLEAARKLFAEGKDLILKHGASNVRIRRWVIGGDIAGIYQASIDFDSMEAFGDYWSSTAGDPDFGDFLSRLRASDSPLEPIGTLQASHIAHYGAEETGDVALVRLWKVEPGRLEEFLGLVQEVIAASNEPGMSVLVQRITVGGNLSGQIVTIGFVESMSKLGAYMDRLENDAELQRLQAQVFGPGGPAQLEAMAISTGLNV